MKERKPTTTETTTDPLAPETIDALRRRFWRGVLTRVADLAPTKATAAELPGLCDVARQATAELLGMP